MALRFLGFLSLLNRTRYSSLPSSYLAASPFSSIDLSQSHESVLENRPHNLPRSHPGIDERFVLQELQELLSIDVQTSDSHQFLDNSVENQTRSLDLRPVQCIISNSHQSIEKSVEERAKTSNCHHSFVKAEKNCLKSSDVLTFDAISSKYKQSVDVNISEGSDMLQIDGFLSPAEKLRGVFLQKLKGKAAVKSALSDTGVDLTPDIVADVVNKGNLGGEAMVMFFDWAITQPKIEKDLAIYHIILKALGRRKFFAFMEEILNRMKDEGIMINNETTLIVIDSYVRARRVAKAFELFGRLEEFGLKRDCDSLNVLLKCLCRRSHVGTADSFLNAVKGSIKFDITAYNVIIGGWAKLGKMSELERNWKAALADGLEPNCLTFSYAIEGLGRAGRVDDAVDVFNKMEEKGCIPDTSVYNAIISNFLSIGDLNECMKYYKGMLGKDCSPNTDTYTKLIDAFIEARRVADALEMYDEMLDRGILPSVGAVTSFIEPLCSFGPPYAAMMIYKKSKKVGCRISMKAYKLLLMRLSRFGKCGMLLKVWEDLQDSGYSFDMQIYEYIINGLCNIGQLDNAVLFMEEALGKGFCPSKVVYSKLNNKLLNASRVETAYRLFLKVKDVRRSENRRRYWRANGWHF